MLLPVLLHLVHNEAECAIDDLLIQLELSLLLIEIFHGSLDLDWVEVKQLIFLLEDFEKTLSLNSLMQDQVLNVSCCLDFLLELLLHRLHLSLHRVDALVVGADALLSLQFFLCNGFFDLLFLSAGLSYLLVELCNSGHVLSVLLLCERDDLVLLLNCALQVSVFLLVNDSCHALDLPHVLNGGLKPLDIRVLRRVHVLIANLDV